MELVSNDPKVIQDYKDDLEYYDGQNPIQPEKVSPLRSFLVKTHIALEGAIVKGAEIASNPKLKEFAAKVNASGGFGDKGGFDTGHVAGDRRSRASSGSGSSRVVKINRDGTVVITDPDHQSHRSRKSRKLLDKGSDRNLRSGIGNGFNLGDDHL